jgi:ABC-type multidrug transport system fused ATPase/permease subunit
LRQITAHIKALLLPAERSKLRWLALLDAGVVLADLASLVVLLLTVQFYTVPTAQLPIALPHWLQNRQGLGLIALVLLAFAVKNAIGYLAQRYLYHFVYQVASRLSARGLLYFLNGHYSGYAQVDTAVPIKRIGQHPVEFAHYLLLGRHHISVQGLLVGAALLGLLLYRAQLFLLLLLLLAPPVALAAWLANRRTKAARQHTRVSSEKALQYVKEALAGYVESRVYQQQAFFVDRYSGHQAQLNHWLAELHSVQGLSARLMELFAVLGLLALVALALFAQSSGIDFFTVGAFLTAAYKVMPGIVKILNTAGQMKVYAYTATDLLQAETEPATGAATAPLQSIEFHQVSYHRQGQALLHHCSFALRPGDFAGVQGVSGQGKTTLLNLLLGFAAGNGGEIRLNGTVTTAMERQGYLPYIAYVKQQPFLLHDSIRRNITLGNDSDADGRLQRAIAQSGLGDLIASQPDGLDALVAENGKNISGGQRQRIALARALYKDAPVLILDEPFSELDTEAETALLQHCRQLAAAGKIVLMVTHNPAALGFCNKIIHLHEKN